MTKSARAAALLEGPVLRSLMLLAVPIILANVLQSAYQLIDAFWVGRLGDAAIAAVSISFPVIFLTIAVGSGLGIAGSILIAQYFGARNSEMVNHVAGQTMLMVVMTSLLLGAVGYVATPFLLKLMGVTPEVYAGAKGYLHVAFAGLVFSFTFIMFQSVMRGIGEMKLPIMIVFGTVIANFFLDPLFIFGWGPVPAMGVMGAALATLATQSVAALIGFAVLFGGRFGIKISLKNFKPDLAFIRKAFFLGLPASIEMSARAFGLIIMTFLIASFGTMAIASYGVGSNMIQVAMIPAMGLSMAISTLVGQNIGAGQMDRAEKIGRLGAMVSFCVLSVFGIIVFAFAPHFVAFFVPGEEDVIRTGATFLRTVSLAWGLLGVQFALSGVLRASGNMLTTMMITIISQWVILFPLAYILSQNTSLGLNGVWWAFPISYLIVSLVSIAIIAKGDWKKKRLVHEDETLSKKVSDEIITEESYTGHQN
ncbi:MATE family efflux transporter [Henriciella litoralis]|uniref:MATE family efflux transporter n=1 Tax=Henriciella litoralis TaxID=568102 RepID=UPI0009FCF75D|nr:MATE family efflux transporter [Henriciella litoralis]